MNNVARKARQWHKGFGVGVISLAFAIVCAIGLAAIMVLVIQPSADRRGFMDLAERANMAWAPFVFVTVPLCIAIRGMTRVPAFSDLAPKYDRLRPVAHNLLPIAILVAVGLRAWILIGEGDYRPTPPPAWLLLVSGLISLVVSGFLVFLTSYLAGIANHESIDAGKSGMNIANLCMLGMLILFVLAAILAIFGAVTSSKDMPFYGNLLSLVGAGVGSFGFVVLWIGAIQMKSGIKSYVARLESQMSAGSEAQTDAPSP